MCMSEQIITNICGKPFSKDDLEHVKEIIRVNSAAHRLKLSQIICEAFNWVSANGHLKEMSCRVALLKLYRKGLIELPAPQRKKNNNAKTQITSISNPRFPIEKNITELTDIRLSSVETKTESRLWNELIERYHYLGHKPLAGGNIKYLISCNEGLLGAISFSASAWKVAPRDKWIGWSHTIREKNLPLIINNSRYLILPWVTVKHLASKVLSICAKQIRSAWKQRYNYKPVLLETFVEKDRFKGTCYKAANWIHIGQTQGRGKRDIHKAYSVPIKDIWMYPLTKDFRKKLQGSA